MDLRQRPQHRKPARLQSIVNLRTAKAPGLNYSSIAVCKPRRGHRVAYLHADCCDCSRREVAHSAIRQGPTGVSPLLRVELSQAYGSARWRFSTVRDPEGEQGGWRSMALRLRKISPTLKLLPSSRLGTTSSMWRPRRRQFDPEAGT